MISFLRNNVFMLDFIWTCQSNGLKENDWFKNNNVINLTFLIGVFILYYVLIGHNKYS